VGLLRVKSLLLMPLCHPEDITVKQNFANLRETRLLPGFLARPASLFIAAALLLFLMLDGRELWTQEHRWADIVSGMFFRHDFFHPLLDSNDYYDKPLLSYWLIALVSFITNQLNLWVLRLPSAFAGLLAVWSIYKLGLRLKDQYFGLLCGWLLTTTFYFIFWSRVSSADMLNLSGSLFAVYWYFEKRESQQWTDYAVFYLILALTSLCKGLVGAVVPVLAILPDLLHEQRFKKYLQWRIIFAGIPALMVYIFPFLISSLSTNDLGHGQNGLYLVYRENILRYFKPFDHKDPVYTYFLYLPIYLLPWSFFFIPALFSLKRRFRSLSWNSKWMAWALFAVFVFFTASGSRRSYYVLPLLPFAVLLTADWLDSNPIKGFKKAWSPWLLPFFFGLLLSYFALFQPLFYAEGGHRYFAEKLQSELNSMQTRETWQFVLLDPETKISFYLHLPPQVKFLGVNGDRELQTQNSLLEAWPQLRTKSKRVVFISRKRYKAELLQLLPHYHLLEAQKTLGERLFHLDDSEAAIAFIPPEAAEVS
ncbi:MAG TPA: glycosyltransferase family 39 protein, partial [Gammaproteobacteria bacterium]|nr:glycosyltransferase family 39 protein [Gammaproteobacteria bacterium]